MRPPFRYVDTEVDPSEKDEPRGVFDLRRFMPFGNGWLTAVRNRIDLRKFEGAGDLSGRYRTRLQIAPLLTVFSRPITGFASYGMFCNSRYGRWGQRHRLIGGVGVTIGFHF